jgi:hypothetical protein
VVVVELGEAAREILEAFFRVHEGHDIFGDTVHVPKVP